jgi:hypothetical protein
MNCETGDSSTVMRVTIPRSSLRAERMLDRSPAQKSAGLSYETGTDTASDVSEAA